MKTSSRSHKGHYYNAEDERITDVLRQAERARQVRQANLDARRGIPAPRRRSSPLRVGQRCSAARTRSPPPAASAPPFTGSMHSSTLTRSGDPMQTRTATITASLRDVLDRIDRLDKEQAAIDNPLIFFDAALALSEARRHYPGRPRRHRGRPAPQASPEPLSVPAGALPP